jgi:hypothetical protein
MERPVPVSPGPDHALARLGRRRPPSHDGVDQGEGGRRGGRWRP